MENFNVYKESRGIAAEIFERFESEHGEGFDPYEYEDEMRDAIRQYVDGHEWVIYYSKAIKFCATCSTDEGEEFVEEMGGFEPGDTFGSIACKIAYGQLSYEVGDAMNYLIENYEGK